MQKYTYDNQLAAKQYMSSVGNRDPRRDTGAECTNGCEVQEHVDHSQTISPRQVNESEVVSKSILYEQPTPDEQEGTKASGTKDLTTGQVATICHVAPRTVAKWFDSGRLKGYRIPGSKDRRIPMESLLAFMKEHDMPLPGLGMER